MASKPPASRNQVAGSGTAETTPATEARDGFDGAVQDALEQAASLTMPTAGLPPLMSIEPPASVRPCGGNMPTPVKKNAMAGFPAWFAAFEARNRTSVESEVTPVQAVTSCPQTKE
jgi:hypothetical protein